MLLIVCSTAVLAQSTPKKGNSHQARAKYTCTMHPEVMSDKPGKCPKCAMALVKVHATAYTCTMHPEVVSQKPGKCPKCGMTLVAKVKSIK